MSIKTFPEESTRLEPKDLNPLLKYAASFDTSDITIQSNAKVIGDIHGKLLFLTKRAISNTEVSALINHIYGPNGTTQILTGKDIDTHYEFKLDRVKKLRFRVNATGCLVDGHDGIQITLRVIPTFPPSIKELKLEANIASNMAPESGIIYVTGATGSGKSTLLAAMIRHIIEQKDSNRKVLTYESPIEFVYDDVDSPSSIVSQSEIPRHLESFAKGVRNALRRKPRLILVGESRDAETISASLEAALTGHPVYTTLHTNGVAETIRRLVTSFPPEEREGRTIDIIETMRVCISQKLVPGVDGKRVALKEYIIMTHELRDKLLKVNFKEITGAIREILIKHGQTMHQAAKIAFQAGEISEEVYNHFKNTAE